MKKPTWMRVALACTLGLVTTAACAVFVISNGQAENTMLLRTTPMEVSGYVESQLLDTADDSADETRQFLDETKPLLLHMEALRRAYLNYGSDTAQKTKLLNTLKQRYMKDADSAEKFFDYGYAQLVMDANKNGLFFLRKANDRIHSPATSLAYGLAEVDADLLMEQSTPDEMTTRKMDAMYKLKDAVMYNMADHLPGVWPSYINILKQIKAYPAYEGLQTEDLSTQYVPYGDIPGISGVPPALLAIASGASPTDSPTGIVAGSASKVEQTCDFDAHVQPPATMATRIQRFEQKKTPKSYALSFYTPPTQEVNSALPYDVWVHDDSFTAVGHFTSYEAPHIVEDIDKDGDYELVVRQFDKDPYHPVQVYRWNGSCFGLDKAISSYFE